ncbi:putative F-box protein At1g71320 [Fagus crenata]
MDLDVKEVPPPNDDELQCSLLLHLPEHIWVEILLRLPLISLLQCECVSNHWCSLISTPDFIHSFIGSQTQPPPFSLLLQHYHPQPLRVISNEPELKSLSYLPDLQQNNEHIKILASHNGLLFCRAIDMTSTLINDHLVINPITMECLTLPPFPQRLRLNNRGSIGFVCSYNIDNSYSYRVVLIPDFHDDYPNYTIRRFRVHIFSSETFEWSESVVLCPEGFIPSSLVYPSVPYKGLLFWCDFKSCLFGFDPYNIRCCRFFAFPENWNSFLRSGPKDYHLGVCRGCLRIGIISGIISKGSESKEFPINLIRVWELKDYNDTGGGKWSLEHKVYVNQMVSEKSPWLPQYVMENYSDYGVQEHHPNDGDIMYLLVKPLVLLCNLRSRTLEIICDLPYHNVDLPHHTVDPCELLNFELPCWPTTIFYSSSQDAEIEDTEIESFSFENLSIRQDFISDCNI